MEACKDDLQSDKSKSWFQAVEIKIGGLDWKLGIRDHSAGFRWQGTDIGT